MKVRSQIPNLNKSMKLDGQHETVPRSRRHNGESSYRWGKDVDPQSCILRQPDGALADLLEDSETASFTCPRVGRMLQYLHKGL